MNIVDHQPLHHAIRRYEIELADGEATPVDLDEPRADAHEPGLGGAVDGHRVGDRRQAARQRDDLVPATADVEIDCVGSRVGVDVLDRLAERFLPRRQAASDVEVAKGIDDEGGQ